MADASAEQAHVHQLEVTGTVADVMRQPLTTVELNDHVAAAAYLMKHAHASALVVLDAQTDEPIGIITEADISHAVADGSNVNEVRIHELMTGRPHVIEADTSIVDAAKLMTSSRFRHLPVVGEKGLIGIVDVTDVCRALVGPEFTREPS
jgi:CBS domain-containing protein